MTAQEALIAENKKDPRVRYITQDEENNTYVWIGKPRHITSMLNYWNGFYAKKLDFQVYFNTEKSEDCILCIDDIKEVPPISEKWYMPVNEENISYINKARKKQLKIGEYTFVVNCGGCIMGNNSIFKYYKEITLEQFKKYVLKEESEEKKEPEKQEIISDYKPFDKSFTDSIANHPIMSIAEAEREESKKEQELSKPPLGLYPRKFWIESRVKSINKAIERYTESWACIPTDWIEERNQLIETLNNL